MSEYEAQIILESNGNKIVITASSSTVADWPEKTMEVLVDALKGQLEGFVCTSREVK